MRGVDTADHSIVRFHGQIRKQTKIFRVYFNNHYGGKAVVNALQFNAMTGHSLSGMETNALKHAHKYLSNHGLITSSPS
jgi:uncharacterized protein YecE (DUF72 family)